jgi:CRP/FNR family transcriptional regulator, cyclic AMP receptor protein
MANAKRGKKTFDPGRVLTGHGPGQARGRFAPGDAVYSQGNTAESLFFVESGWIKMATRAAGGKEAVVALRGPGDFCGSRCLLGVPRSATATALTDCTVVEVTRSALIRMLREMPDFAEMYATYLVRQGMHDQQNVVDHLTHSAEQRLARMLLRLANNGRGGSALPTKISQALFAQMVGTTRSRVSVFMGRFRRQGFIDYGRDGRVRVHQALRNALTKDRHNP